jgi:hypothetical protein
VCMCTSDSPIHFIFLSRDLLSISPRQLGSSRGIFCVFYHQARTLAVPQDCERDTIDIHFLIWCCHSMRVWQAFRLTGVVWWQLQCCASRVTSPRWEGECRNAEMGGILQRQELMLVCENVFWLQECEWADKLHGNAGEGAEWKTKIGNECQILELRSILNIRLEPWVLSDEDFEHSLNLQESLSKNAWRWSLW